MYNIIIFDWDVVLWDFKGEIIVWKWLILIIILVEIFEEMEIVCRNMIIGYMGLENI